MASSRAIFVIQPTLNVASGDSVKTINNRINPNCFFPISLRSPTLFCQAPRSTLLCQNHSSHACFAHSCLYRRFLSSPRSRLTPARRPHRATRACSQTSSTRCCTRRPAPPHRAPSQVCRVSNRAYHSAPSKLTPGSCVEDL